MSALVLGGWLGPLVILVAVLLGGCALRVVDRFETRHVTARRRRARGGATHSRLRVPAPHLIAHGQAARWNETTERYVKDSLAT